MLLRLKGLCEPPERPSTYQKAHTTSLPYREQSKGSKKAGQTRNLATIVDPESITHIDSKSKPSELPEAQKGVREPRLQKRAREAAESLQCAFWMPPNSKDSGTGLPVP